jgi:hypothetical protein
MFSLQEYPKCANVIYLQTPGRSSTRLFID